MDYMMNKKLDMISPKPRKKSLDMIEEKMNSIFFHGKKVAFVGLCGGQASGKTKIADYFHKNIPGSAVITEKNFYKCEKKKRKFSASDEPIAGDADGYSQERKLLLIELSTPECYDHEALYDCMVKLTKGEKVYLPYFDVENNAVIKDHTEIDPKKETMIIIEGYFIFKQQKIRDLFDLKMFTEVDDDIRLSRLSKFNPLMAYSIVLRENEFLNNNPNAFKTFFLIYEKYLKTTYESNIEVGKKYANIILPNYEVTENNEIEGGDDTLEFLLVNLKNINKH